MNLSPRVPVCRSGRQHGGQGSCQRRARKGLRSQVSSKADEVLSPAGQSLWWPMPREINMVRSSTLVCGAQLSQQWSGACLSYTFKGMYSTLLGLFDKCLDTSDAKYGIFPRSPWLVHGSSAWHFQWQVGNLPRSLSMGGPTLQTRLFWPRVQIS